MSTGLITTADSNLSIYTQSARRYAQQSKSPRTLRIYGIAWREFEGFAHEHGAKAIPATVNVVIAYLTALADGGAKTSTIAVKLAAVGFYHRQQHQPDPTTDVDVRAVMAGIRRELGTRPDKKAPVLLTSLRRMVATLPDTLAGRRDAAMLLIGFAGAFRRSELVALTVADITINDNDMTIRIRKSKTDQEGKGLVKAIPRLTDVIIDPITALRAWLAASEIRTGPLFRPIDRWGHVRDKGLNDKQVERLVKSVALAAGLEPRQFAGHSLRSGFITEAAKAGIASRDIMAQTGHKSEAVMRDYIQDAGHGAMTAVRGAFGE